MDKKKSELIRELKKFKEDNKIQKLILFGSRAKYKVVDENSDVDLIVVSSRFNGIKSFKRYPLLRRKWKLAYPVDMLCYTPEEFKKSKSLPTIIREAVKNGIEI